MNVVAIWAEIFVCAFSFFAVPAHTLQIPQPYANLDNFTCLTKILLLFVFLQHNKPFLWTFYLWNSADSPRPTNSTTATQPAARFQIVGWFDFARPLPVWANRNLDHARSLSAAALNSTLNRCALELRVLSSFGFVNSVLLIQFW